MLENILKSGSKIGGFIILGICSTYAFMHIFFEALQLGVIAFVILVGGKTAVQGMVDIGIKKK